MLLSPRTRKGCYSLDVWSDAEENYMEALQTHPDPTWKGSPVATQQVSRNQWSQEWIQQDYSILDREWSQHEESQSIPIAPTKRYNSDLWQ